MTSQGNLPFVSIITPSLNQGRFIRDTIESVLSQEYPRLEYIIMDGGSTDDTLDILRSYGGRLIWRSAPDSGQAEAVNRGFRLAKGDILGRVNSDDTYLPGTVKAAVGHLAANTETAVVYGDAYYIDEKIAITGTYPTEDFSLSRLAGLFEEIYAVAEQSFGQVSPHWRVCRAYYRPVGFSWPLARWVVWPARQMLPEGVHHWLRKKFPPLVSGEQTRWVSLGGKR
jgi:glycosyltransferase involved in cell wall biosynthesis